MAIKSTSKYRIQCIRSLFVLGIAFYLIKGQSSLYASSDCSGDPIAATVELVLSDTPGYGFHFQPVFAQILPAGTAIALPASNFRSGHSLLSAQHDTCTRLVLKSTGFVFDCQQRSNLSSNTRAKLHQSQDADPLLA